MMNFKLSEAQRRFQGETAKFVQSYILPHAEQFDAEQCLPSWLVEQLGERGYLGCLLPESFGGQNIDAISYGLLNEEINKACSSVRSLITVHTMVCHTLERWGSSEQKNKWLPRLSSGEWIAAFALTEPKVGSDSAGIQTTVRKRGNSYIINGTKKWITAGQIADVFLVFAKFEDQKHTAFLVEKNISNIRIEPIRGMLGTSGSMLAEVTFDNCEIPKANCLGSVGFGLTAIANCALDLARYSVAWGCVGMSEACLSASLNYSNLRTQFGAKLKNHQLISRLLTNMIANVRAAKLLCLSAGCLRQSGDPKSIGETCLAKYFASLTATKAANDAVQIHGAIGCSSESPVARFYRDAKIMQIIEGSNEIQQLLIPNFALEDY